jgi:hypothetical protein
MSAPFTADARTRGHGSTGMAKFWKAGLQAFVQAFMQAFRQAFMQATAKRGP